MALSWWERKLAQGSPRPQVAPWCRQVKEYSSEWGKRKGGNSEQPLSLAWGSGHLCHHGFVSPSCFLPLPSGWVQKATGLVLFSSWPLRVIVKSKQENGKGVNKWILGKKPGDSGRASRGRTLGGLALILWVLHQFLSRGGGGGVSIPSLPTVALASGVLPEEPGHGISGGRPGNQGQSHAHVMEGPAGVQFSGALKYSSHC